MVYLTAGSIFRWFSLRLDTRLVDGPTTLRAVCKLLSTCWFHLLYSVVCFVSNVGFRAPRVWVVAYCQFWRTGGILLFLPYLPPFSPSLEFSRRDATNKGVYYEATDMFLHGGEEYDWTRLSLLHVWEVNVFGLRLRFLAQLDAPVRAGVPSAWSRTAHATARAAVSSKERCTTMALICSRKAPKSCDVLAWHGGVFSFFFFSCFFVCM